jgi:hypothetical protein
MKITAYTIYNPLSIEIPSKKRKWMDDTHNAFAYRCLPLTVANGFGWNVLNPHRFSVTWNGGKEIKDLVVNDPTGKHLAQSHFGSGVVTFNLGFLIRTESNHNLYVKGPANNPKRGVTALEGVVETDWLPFTFTMNWKITEPNFEVVFEEGEPICSFFPFERGYLEKWEPEVKEIVENPEIFVKYHEWAGSRMKYNKTLDTNGNRGERDYLRGQHKDGTKFEGHQNNITAKDFTKAQKPAIIEQPCFDNCCLEPNS